MVMSKLISLSKILKNGFTVKVNNGVITQYNDTNKPYIVSYKTLITIKKDIVTFKDTHIPNKGIIGGWLDTDTNIYYIELNRVYRNKAYALRMALKYRQRAIYDSNKQEVIKVV